jgi:ATP-dependent helicase/nuclease subunit A
MSNFKPIKEQIQASAPQSNIWVTANAGSGKTSVLTSRFIRLMLDGARPEKILCITFTNAGAAEMREKIFNKLSTLALLPLENRKSELSQLLGDIATDKQAKQLQELYLKIIDRPDKIRILTIHSLCQHLLKKFALEAGVQPYFQVIDELAQNELITESQNRLFSLKLYSKDGKKQYAEEIVNAIKDIAKTHSETTIREAISAMLKKGHRFLQVIEAHESLENYLANLKTILKADFEESELSKNLYNSLFPQLTNIAVKLSNGPKKAQDIANDITNYAHSKSVEHLRSALFTKEGEPKKLASLAVVKNDDSLALEIDKATEKLVDFEERITSKKLYKTTENLTYIVYGIIQIYEYLKDGRSALDYNDLIHKTTALLNDKEATSWVLYKLDGGIEHLMLDEAQDTSPEQWQIVNALTTEFFSEETKRTLFVVGDEKQSIYRFQGADINNFYDQKRRYQNTTAHLNNRLELVPFNMSFRTLPAILNVVDKTFEPPHLKAQITDDESAINHAFFRGDNANLTGYFELKPPIIPEKKDKIKHNWHLPESYPESEESSARKILAANIANDIATMVKNGRNLPSQSRPVRAGDIMILLKNRDELFRELPRELLKHGIKTTGGDRLNIAEQIAAEDLLSFAKFLTLPEDDHNFACLLKSPIIGLSEQQLFELAYKREEVSLYKRFLQQSHEYPSENAMLSHFLNIVDYNSPYEIFTELLEVNNIRQKFYKRLGAESKAIIDEFINLTAKFEANYSSGMQGFITWFKNSDAEFKNSPANNPDEVRLLTVHGSKGLEAPIVILANAMQVNAASKTEKIYFLDDHFICPLLKELRNQATNELIESEKTQEENEYFRLLYVAMTRARDELYVYGAQSRNASKNNWYTTIHTAIQDMEHKNVNESIVIASESYIQAASMYDAVQNTNDAKLDLAAFGYMQNVPKFTNKQQVFSPSHLIEIDEIPYKNAKKQGSTGGELEKERGNIIHKLFENLPKIAPDQCQKYAENIFKSSNFKDRLKLDDILNETITCLKNPEFAQIFSENSMVEVPVMGEVDGKMLSGKIDRMIITDEKVIIVDYKTNRKIADVNSQTHNKYRRQLLSYKQLMQKIYPQKAIETIILWSAENKLENVQ